jgi:hypothetical protein
MEWEKKNYLLKGQTLQNNHYLKYLKNKRNIKNN